jgi:hypothetical protein
MAMKDGEIQVVSLFGTVVLTAALFAPVLYLTEKAEAQGGDLKEMDTIEASLAYRKTPQKQPQKRLKSADPLEKPEGVSHDDTRKPIDKKDEDKKPPKKDDDPLARFKHPTDDDDTATGKPVTNVGDFNGSEKGFADETKGDPWMAQLRADMNYNPPEIAKGNGVPLGCIHVTADGKITDTKFFVRTDDDLQTAAEAAIDGLKKFRNDKPVEVPTHLLSITTKWLCFKFNVKSS